MYFASGYTDDYCRYKISETASGSSEQWFYIYIYMMNNDYNDLKTEHSDFQGC